MQVSVENTSSVKRTLTVTVPVDMVEKAYKKSFLNVAKKAKIDGFRKGHIPTTVLNQYFGQDIVEGGVKNVIDATIFEALKSEKIDFLGAPAIKFIKDVEFAKDKEFKYEVEVEVLPKVEFKPFTDLDLSVYNSKVEDKDVDEMIENLRQQQATWKTVDGAEATKESQVIIDFVGSVDGVEFSGGKAENYELNIATTPMIPGFSEQIVGHKAGDEFTIDVKFPDDYHAEELKGKAAQFKITLHSVAEKNLPEVDAEFIKIYGVKDGSIEKFRAELKSNMERECVRALAVNNRSQLYKKLSETYKDIEIPQAFVEERMEFLKKRTANEFKRMGINKLPEFKDDMFADEAKKAALVQTLVLSYMDQNDIKEPSEAAIETELNLIAGAYEEPEKLKADIKANKQRMAQIKDVALDHEIVSKMIESANAKVEDVAFMALINMRPEF